MAIAQGATPYIMISIEGYDLTDAAALMVTIRTQTGRLDLDGSRVTVTSDGEDSLLTVHLSQDETLALYPNIAVVQVRWRDANGEAYTTEMAQISVANAIYREVI